MPATPSLPDWNPSTPALRDGDLRSSVLTVVHYWAIWNYRMDSELDRRLASLRPEYDGKIVFRSCDTDRPGNREFLSEVGCVPTLGSYVRGSRFKLKAGLRTEAELRRILDEWLAEAVAG